VAWLDELPVVLGAPTFSLKPISYIKPHRGLFSPHVLGDVFSQFHSLCVFSTTMHRSNLLPILGLTLSTTQITHCQTHKNTSLLTWGPCSDIRGSRITTNTSCANLTVPLDYTAKESTKTLDLQILRVAAKKTPALGSIILNFGGPGVDGRTQLVQVGDYLQEITGGQHHLVTFDPRCVYVFYPFTCLFACLLPFHPSRHLFTDE